ncbi:hypothetical protein PTI98_006747 [Pleurotus ostreatus]|nr:hypothetical protein PTI98_006747 [Pleurotus ostreatus]
MTGRVLSLLPYLITIFALSLPSPSFPLRLSLFLLILALTTHILTSTALPLASLNFSQGAALAAHVFAASDFLLLSHVHTDLKRNGQTGAWETMGQWERVRWAVSLVTSPRLIGWSSTSTSTPRPPPLHASPSPSTSTTSFILRQLLHLLLELLTLLAFITLSPSLPHLSASGPTLASAPYPLRLLYAPLLGLAMYASIDAPHRIWLLLLLCIGNPLIYVHNHASVSPLLLWTPADFQPLFGKWSDAYTVRRFWGRTWQQTHRRAFIPNDPIRVHSSAFIFTHQCIPSRVQMFTHFTYLSSPHFASNPSIHRSILSFIHSSLPLSLYLSSLYPSIPLYPSTPPSALYTPNAPRTEIQIPQPLPQISRLPRLPRLPPSFNE